MSERASTVLRVDDKPRYRLEYIQRLDMTQPREQTIRYTRTSVYTQTRSCSTQDFKIMIRLCSPSSPNVVSCECRNNPAKTTARVLAF